MPRCGAPPALLAQLRFQCILLACAWFVCASFFFGVRRLLDELPLHSASWSRCPYKISTTVLLTRRLQNRAPEGAFFSNLRQQGGMLAKPSCRHVARSCSSLFCCLSIFLPSRLRCFLALSHLLSSQQAFSVRSSVQLCGTTSSKTLGSSCSRKKSWSFSNRCLNVFLHAAL